MLEVFINIGLIVLLYMTLFFVLAQFKKDNSIVDIGWGLGFILVALFSILYEGLSNEKIILTSMIVVWGIRLSIHIYLRNKGKGEDWRYKKWREEWSNFALRSYFQIFLLQGVLLVFISLPVIFVNSSPASDLSALNYIGIIVWLVGFFFEVVGDYQLSEFTKNKSNKGKIMSSGLWRYTRHPNYFGEVLIWWGIWIYSQNLAAIVSPILITYLILKVSGITMLEERWKGNQDYIYYKERTSAFFPWFPKR